MHATYNTKLKLYTCIINNDIHFCVIAIIYIYYIVEMFDNVITDCFKTRITKTKYIILNFVISHTSLCILQYQILIVYLILTCVVLYY